ncbi:828_t:CDS:2, partial [Entrophospora sp. SA101]
STRERELESERNELLIKTEFFANKCSDFRNAKVLAETRSDELAKELKSKNEKILRLRKKLNRITDAKTRNDSNMKQFKEEIKQLQSKNTNLVSQGALKELSLTGYQTKYYKKMEEANSFQSRIKSLEEKLFSAQKDSSLKASGIDSLKSKITELERMKDELSLKVSELEHLKSEDISEPTVGGDVEKNMQSDEQSSITKSDDISAISEPIKNLSQYFIRKKNMDQVRKIDGNISDHTRHDGITEPSKVDTEISSKINEETNINEISKDILLVQEIKNVTPHLAQLENHTSSLIESHPQISVGGIEAIPAVARTLMSPLSAYIFLILLIIAVMWFVVLRRTWGLKRKSEQMQDVCKEPSSPLYTDCIVTHSFMVVGMRFRGGHKFKKSDTITLEPEPSNTYDKNAIKIMVDGIHKAYVAKDENMSRYTTSIEGL